MNILITGTDGFIGAALKEHLTKAGHRVTGTVFHSIFDINSPRKNNSSHRRKNSSITRRKSNSITRRKSNSITRRAPESGDIVFDIRCKEDFRKLPRDTPDAVIHTIGIIDQTSPSRLMFEVNAGGAARMAAWARERGCTHFIHLSSVSVYGLKTLGMNREEKMTPRCRHPFVLPYMKSKALAERLIENDGVPYTILRLPAMIGRQDTYLSPALISFLEQGRFFLCGKGARPVSLLNIKNLGILMEILLSNGPLHDVFNCCDFHVDFCTLAQAYARALGIPYMPKKRSLLTLPFFIHDKQFQLILTFSRFGAHFPDTKLHRVLPHEHPYSWEDGVTCAVAGYMEQKLNTG